MSVIEQQKAIVGDYQYGFHDEENYVYKSERGLDRDKVAQISKMKGEPDWMLDFRLKAYDHYVERPMPTWGGDLSGIDFDDARLLGRMVVPNGRWRLVGTVMHLVNGAVFGALFVKFLKRPSVGKGLAAAQIENAVLWPTLALIDPIHPDRRNGHWPRFMTSPRIIVSEVIGHAIFGTVLGALTSRALKRGDGDA